MKNLSMALILFLFSVAIYFSFKPFIPTISHQMLNCKRYKQTQEILERAANDLHAKRISPDQTIVEETNSVEINEYFDAWGHKIMSKKGKEDEFFSIGDTSSPGHHIALGNDESLFYCGSYTVKILNWFKS